MHPMIRLPRRWSRSGCVTVEVAPPILEVDRWALPESPSGAIARLVEAAALWSIDVLDADVVVDAAGDVLAHGSAGDGIVALASLYRDASAAEFEQVLVWALAELDHPLLLPTIATAELHEIALTAMCRRCLTGELTERRLAAWAWRAFDWSALGVAGRLVHLEDEYDVAYEASVFDPREIDRINASERASARSRVSEPEK
jgi:hypothetical protein